MKISEILTEGKTLDDLAKYNPETDEVEYDYEFLDQINQATEVIGTFTNGWSGGPEINQAWKFCMEVFPMARVHGDMYRALAVDIKQFLSRDPQGVLALLQQKMTKYERKIVSWSKKAEHTLSFVATSPVGVVLHQKARGLDVQELYIPDLDIVQPIAFEGEEEILAPMSPGVSIYGFVLVPDKDSDPVFYPVKDYDKFISAVRSKKG